MLQFIAGNTDPFFIHAILAVKFLAYSARPHGRRFIVFTAACRTPKAFSFQIGHILFLLWIHFAEALRSMETRRFEFISWLSYLMISILSFEEDAKRAAMTAYFLLYYSAQLILSKISRLES